MTLWSGHSHFHIASTTEESEIGTAGGTDKEKTIAQEFASSSAWRSSKKKKTKNKTKTTCPGSHSARDTKILERSFIVSRTFATPLQKTALRKFPRKSKWMQEQPELRSATTVANHILPTHVPSPLHARFFHPAAHRAAQPLSRPASDASQVLPRTHCPGASQGPGRDQGTPLPPGSASCKVFPDSSTRPPPHSQLLLRHHLQLANISGTGGHHSQPPQERHLLPSCSSSHVSQCVV